VSGEIKSEALLRTVKISRDLTVIILIVSSVSRDLDFLDVSVFSNIGRPLHDRSRETYAGDNALEQLQLRYSPSVLIAMKFLQ